MWETHSISESWKSEGGRTPSDEESQTPFTKEQSKKRWELDSPAAPQRTHEDSTIKCRYWRLAPEGIMLDRILPTVILTLGGMQAFPNIPQKEP